MSISNKLYKLQNRRTDSTDTVGRVNDSHFSRLLNSRYVEKSISEQSEVETYILESMAEVDPSYTEKSFAEARRIVNHLKNDPMLKVEFNFQGSVTNNTNIKYVSDIDLLVVDQKSFLVQPPNQPIVSYQGDPVKDLVEIRNRCAKTIREAFPKASVDVSGSKSIAVSGGSLTRKVDVVPCNWWHTVDYMSTKNEVYRGVSILDSHKQNRINNMPFLHNERIKEKDQQCNYRFKPVVRLLKTIKSEADVAIEVSSYSITCLLYHMNNNFLVQCNGAEATLSRLELFFSEIVNNPNLLNGRHTPNGLDLIADAIKIADVNRLRQEIVELRAELAGV